MAPVRMGHMGKSEAGIGSGQDSFLKVRVELVDSDPEIWRQLEIRSTLTLDQVHRVLQAAFDWEDVHLHRFTSSHPFAPLRPVNGAVLEASQWLPRQDCEEPSDRPEEDCSLAQLFALQWRYMRVFEYILDDEADRRFVEELESAAMSGRGIELVTVQEIREGRSASGKIIGNHTEYLLDGKAKRTEVPWQRITN